jgi:N-acetylmuramoyl-L-alanine amidase
VFKSVTIIFGAAILLAGCATAPTPPEETIEPTPMSKGSPLLNWSSTNVVQRSSTFEANQPVESFPQERFPITASPKPTNPPVTTWTSLNGWTAGHKIGKPHWLSDLPVSSYAVGSANGVMIFEIGSRDATWNGTEINLGFEPQFIDGEIFLYGLDLQKNFAPLLCEPPLTFRANRVIVIDPGHGGSNTGTHSVLDGRFEKEFTLDWAKRLAPLLATNGWQVFLTRTNDVAVSLADRVAFAEARHADLFISLHFNSGAPDEKQAGLETYCLTPTGMPSTLTRGYEDNWLENLPNNAFDAQNLQLAVKLHSALLRATGIEDRGVRRARFIGVLRGQKRPAILIEAGYLSNPREARLIEDPAYRQKLAETVATALK